MKDEQRKQNSPSLSDIDIQSINNSVYKKKFNQKILFFWLLLKFAIPLWKKYLPFEKYYIFFSISHYFKPFFIHIFKVIIFVLIFFHKQMYILKTVISKI